MREGRYTFTIPDGAACSDLFAFVVALPADLVEQLEAVVTRRDLGRDRVIDLALRLWLALEASEEPLCREDAAWLAAWKR